MANNFREIRRKPPLFEHRGDKSTLAKVDWSNPEGPLNWTRKINQKYDLIKVYYYLGNLKSESGVTLAMSPYKEGLQFFLGSRVSFSMQI